MTVEKYNEFPDAEAVVGNILRAAEIAGLDERVYSSIPAKPTFPLAVMVRTGGVAVERHHMDGPRIDVSVWGGDQGDAHDIAQACRAALHDAAGTFVELDWAKVWISGVDDSTGLQRIGEPTTGRERYLFSVYMYMRQTENTNLRTGGFGLGGFGEGGFGE